MRYIASTPKKRFAGWVGDNVDECALHAYADADFAGCERTMRSTTGFSLLMEGPHTSFPIAGRSCRQGCICTSTPEAEMVACHFTYKNVLLPTFEIWDAFLPGGWHPYLHEDDQAMEKIIQTGRNPTMKTLGRYKKCCSEY